MQTALAFGQSTDLAFVRDRLLDRFGPVRDVHRHDPISQLVKTAISGRTRDEISSAAFERLVAQFPDVEKLAETSAVEIEFAISGVTHAQNKAVYLRDTLQKIRARSGRI